MKRFIFFALAALLFAGQTNAQSNKTLMKSFNLDGNTTVQVDLGGQVVLEEWNNDFIRVISDVEVINVNESVLKSLISAGRYNLEANSENGVLLVSAPKISKVVVIGGRELQDNVIHKVMVPDGVSIEIVSDQLQSASNTETPVH